ncbi:MAG: hypothetical protein EOO12_02660 [Chitinophagaceae bacterium]|nr:MAG: hypothetical protein EOO12_02660 [Chitinophagaceae bacterium]
MARKKNDIDPAALALLLEAVRRSFGSPVTYGADCALLSADIARSTGQVVSTQTLRRLFGFIRSPFAPSVRTLHSLAQYSGYPDWPTFLRERSTFDFVPLEADQESRLYLDFFNIQLQEESDMNYHNASRNIALRILLHTPLLHRVAPLLLKTETGRRYFFEKFPYIDGLCGDYRQYLFLYVKQGSTETRVFGNALLCLGAFLKGDRRAFLQAFTKVADYDWQRAPHPFLAARCLGTRLLHARLLKLPADELLEEIQQQAGHHSHLKPIGFWRYDFFHHLIAEYLLLTGHLHECWRLLLPLRGNGGRYIIEAGYPEGMQVSMAVARWGGKPELLRRWIDEDLASFQVHPLFRHYYELLALRVYLNASGRSGKKARARVAELVRRTGFTFFLDV